MYNEDSGDYLDKIYATIEMPTRTQASEKDKKVQEVTASPNDPNSVTPIPQAHQRRVLKLGPTKKSPFVDIERKAIASNTTNELYNKVCAYTKKDANDPSEEPIIIDYGTWYINLKDFADSVRPSGLLSNSTCQMALNTMSVEMAKQKKFLMPLRIAGKLRMATCFLDNTVKEAFANCPVNRLDHKELIMFSVLQDLTPNLEANTGHYYLIILNLKAERFEVMDSLRREGDKGLQADYRAIIGSIKNMWARNYSQSKFNISKYRTLHIPTPMQSTTFDCGYFMLKFIECWNERMMMPFQPADMPVIRKYLVQKMLARAENRITNWHEVLFQT
uniref:Uncharacterized protein n=1 Tax=Avena sativa TaxID=4498 RepID=A0ACD5XW89_AVESA